MNKRNNPLPSETWRHYKGGEYKIINVAKHSETNEPLVVYQSNIDNEVWVLPLKMFMNQAKVQTSGGQIDLVDRFEKIADGGNERQITGMDIVDQAKEKNLFPNIGGEKILSKNTYDARWTDDVRMLPSAAELAELRANEIILSHKQFEQFKKISAAGGKIGTEKVNIDLNITVKQDTDIKAISDALMQKIEQAFNQASNQPSK